MKDVDGRWQNRFRVVGAILRRPHAATLAENPASGSSQRATEHESGTTEADPQTLRHQIGASALAFRGYDVSNLGRSRELLDHPRFGSIVANVLAEASAITSDTLHRPIDLVSYVRLGEPTSLAHFAEDVALIVGMELAQLRLLEDRFGIEAHRARLSFGYSIGELAALVFGGVFRLDQLLPVPLELAADCAELAADTSMGILFTRAPELPEAEIDRLCMAVSSEGRGMIAPSAWLSPNTALLLGQGDTLDRFEKAMHDALPDRVLLRRNPHKWPPLHTPIVWQRNIGNRAAVALYKIAAEAGSPTPPVLCGVTGEMGYDSGNCRDLLGRWVDRPQRLWDAIDATLSSGVDYVLHVGPAPNLVPATFDRLTNNVRKQLGRGYRRKMGEGLANRLGRYAWLGHMLPHRAALLRAPLLHHVILEDWLLEQPIN